jgi:hypothetical protein
VKRARRRLAGSIPATSLAARRAERFARMLDWPD